MLAFCTKFMEILILLLLIMVLWMHAALHCGSTIFCPPEPPAEHLDLCVHSFIGKAPWQIFSNEGEGDALSLAQLYAEALVHVLRCIMQGRTHITRVMRPGHSCQGRQGSSDMLNCLCLQQGWPMQGLLQAAEAAAAAVREAEEAAAYAAELCAAAEELEATG